ncbi:hypothetical protein NBRC110019_28270 [Neptunitalea chrysea]|uniref:Uncharacterized protein n=1 Tax=Neptunitalea chrysea TaxID=1647581 RepID=A0A9W6B766_9FLAO|nr:hypothetical protein [Neptunitalea chrysea]GLB53786.1 hypothetical protein NBRC110019_28270 [Neptunitalea chrysea]
MDTTLLVILGLTGLVAVLFAGIKLLILVTDKVTNKLAKEYCEDHGYKFVRLAVSPEEYVLHFKAHKQLFMVGFNVDKGKRIRWIQTTPEKEVREFLENYRETKVRRGLNVHAPNPILKKIG